MVAGLPPVSLRFCRVAVTLATSLRLLADCSAPVRRESLPAATVPAEVPTLADSVPEEIASPEPTMTPPSTVLVAVGSE